MTKLPFASKLLVADLSSTRKILHMYNCPQQRDLSQALQLDHVEQHCTAPELQQSLNHLVETGARAVEGSLERTGGN